MRTKAFVPLVALLGIATLFAVAIDAFASYAACEKYAIYENTRFGFSLLVPADMHAQESEADGGQEILFSDPSNNKEFTVTATPYSQLDVTLGREGDPSGTADQPDHLEIVNIRRDDVVRVWFTKNGVLYTIVTLPDLEPWLTSNILKTWQFD